MNIVKQWLPQNVYCYSQVFCTDEYAEILSIFPEFPLDQNEFLPKALHESSLARRMSYFAGRGCALRALEMAEVNGVSQLIIGRTDQGLPVWPQGFTGSISHAVFENTGFAIAIVANKSTHQSIAIDCEPVFTQAHANEVAPLTASVNEQRIGERLGVNRELWLTMIYSLKETLFKLLYGHVNCFMPFEAAELLSFEVESWQACLMLTVDWGDLPIGQRFWLRVMRIEVENIGGCVVSFGAV